MLKFKIWMVQRFYRVGLFWWKWWSKLYRWLHHRKFYYIPLEENLKPAQVQNKLHLVKWTKDGPKELWDSCGSPHWVQNVIDEVHAGQPQPKGALDCDDFAMWAVHSVGKKYNPRIFSFTWIGTTLDPYGGEKKKIQGHAMCLITEKNRIRDPKARLYHIGNWGKSQYRFSLKGLSTDILKNTGSTQAVGWALLDKDLNVLKYGVGLPDEDIR
jgi:hypothetical protein